MAASGAEQSQHETKWVDQIIIFVYYLSSIPITIQG